MTAPDFWSWLQVGIEHGWVTEPVCSTHDCPPMTADEEAEFEDGGDPCMTVIRVWTEKVWDDEQQLAADTMVDSVTAE